MSWFTRSETKSERLSWTWICEDIGK